MGSVRRIAGQDMRGALMDLQYFSGNRARLYAALPAVPYWQCFPGEEIRKTSDEFYPCRAEFCVPHRPGMQTSGVLAMKDGAKRCGNGYISCRPTRMPSAGRASASAPARPRPLAACDVRRADAFSADLHALATSGHYERLYLDLYRMDPKDIERPAHRCCSYLARQEYLICKFRQRQHPHPQAAGHQTAPGIAAVRQAEAITREGILAMMRALQARYVRIPIQSGGIRPRAGPVWPQRPRLPFHHLGRQKQFLHPLL